MRKIRFWSTVGDAYSFVFGDATRLVRLSWFWWLAALFLAVAVNTAASRLGLVEQGYLRWLIEYVAMVPTLSAFAVSWHRAILIGNDPSWTSIHVGVREWRYTLFSLVVVTLTGGPFAQLLGGDEEVGAMAFVPDALVIVFAVVAVRFSPVCRRLPSSAP